MNFADMAMDFDALDVLPAYNLAKKSSSDRLARLRGLMAELGLDGYLIVDSDAHYTFYAQARQDRRINYITNSEVVCRGLRLTVGAMRNSNCGQGESGFQTIECLFIDGRSGDR